MNAREVWKKSLMIIKKSSLPVLIFLSALSFLKIMKIERRTGEIIEFLALLEAKTDESGEMIKKIEEKVFILALEKESADKEFDKKIVEKMEKAQELFREKKYKECIAECRGILEKDEGNMRTRFMKMLSLFYMNKLDSANYPEILEDLRKLEEGGFKDKRMEEVKDFIRNEGGVN